MKEWKIVFWLTAAAVGFRFLHYLIFAGEVVVGPDQIQNITLARRFAGGDLYGVLDVYWTPLYPILIGTLTYFINSLVTPSLIISIVAGGLAVPLTYFLVKQSYGQREAVIAAVIAVFYPHLINSVFLLGTENIYLLWVIGAVFIGWKALKTDLSRDYLLTGILLGLAYLTRPEAFGYPLFFVLLFTGKKLWQKNLPVRSSLTPIFILLLGFAVLAGPYIFYLRSATGSWTISGKTEINTIAAEYSEEDVQPETAAPPTGLNLKKCRVLIESFFINLIIIHKGFPYLLPVFLLMLVALGLFGENWNTEKLEREGYLILFCLTTVVGYAVSTIQTRYFYVLLPIFFGWIARGIVQTEQRFHELIKNHLSDKFIHLFVSKRLIILALVAMYFYVLPLNFFVHSEAAAWEAAAFEERDAGVWLKQNGKPSPLIFSASFRPVFYAEGRPFPIETTDAKELLAQIKDQKADYVVTSERSLKRHPYLKDFNEYLQNSPDFELVYETEKPDGYKIWIYELR